MATFSSTPLVQVRIQGQDSKLISRFSRFLLESNAIPVLKGGCIGGCEYCGYFRPADAEKATAWLEKHGVTRKI